ncbi:chromosome partitioning protein ParA [Hydrogenophaga sp.]|uniref:chromosome partitioning protein ParA n=1 Tax=Hydrogenophaga sp. TaxID=1904254 RepID=UPI002CA69573|nr:chromosome partitioning protein ParA [Hydrogenophaga sp.]HMP10022.1 chromosome partitioning protein ParA [Hydrogenophaga sp.]
MNKILIVGHPQSGHEDVEQLLNACGMASAQPSRREGYLPQQISATLCKAHNTGTLQRIEAGADVQQIEAGPVWNGMALDLMLGNLEQSFWGWSDPQSVFLLDYWRNLDPAITFVLVYDQPQSVLTRLDAPAAAELSPQALQQRVQGWSAFNAALLHFFLRHPERCLLVHAQQVRESAASYLQQMRARIDAPWSEHAEQLGGPLALTDGQTDETGVITPQRAAPDALATFLADALLSQHPASLQLYEELQACANLPLSDDVGRAAPAALEAWHTMGARQLELQAQAHELDQREQATRALQAQVDAAQALATQRQALADQLDQARQRAEQLAQQRQQVLDEQARLHASESQQQQARLAELASARDKLETRQREVAEENELLLNQLHQVQEELERHYLDAQQKAQRLEALQQAEASLRQNTDQQQKQLAEQQEQLRLQQERLTELQARLKLKEQEAQKQLAALQTELQSTKAQVSEPPAELLQENELLLNQLHQVQEELERYYLEAQKLKQQLPPPQPAKPVHYGAAQRVQQQLGYRLGATMIERSRSVGGWLGMPFALMRVARQHKRELPQRQAQRLPPISQYRDAHEAERVRQHLSYRLGQALLHNVRTPVGWVRLPWALRREVRDFRRQRQAQD